MTRRTRLTRTVTRAVPAMALLAGAAALAAPPAAATAAQAASPQWVETWAASQTPPATTGISATGLDDQTVRMIVHTSAGGSGLRIQLSNEYGNAPVDVGDVSVGVQESGAAEVAGTAHPLLPTTARADSHVSPATLLTSRARRP